MADLDQISRAIGELQGSQRALQYEIADMKKRVSQMDETIQQAKGGWKTLFMIAGAAGAAGALIGKFLHLPWILK